MAYTRRLPSKGKSFSSFGSGGSREGPGGPGPPYFSTKLRPSGTEKIFFETLPSPPYFKGWMTESPLCEALDPPLFGYMKGKGFHYLNYIKKGREIHCFDL